MCPQWCYLLYGIGHHAWVRYLYTVSQALRRPIVMRLALGSNQGGHDEAVLSAAIWLSFPAPMDRNIHIGRKWRRSGKTLFSYHNDSAIQNDFELLVEMAIMNFHLEIWSSYSRLSVRFCTQSWNHTAGLPFLFDCRRDFSLFFMIAFYGSIIWCLSRIQGPLINPVRFHNALPGTWTIRIRNLENEAFTFHACCQPNRFCR